MEKLDALDLEEIRYIENQISYMKHKNLLAGLVHFPNIEFDDDDNSYEDNHKYIKKIDKTKLKWEKQPEKDSYVKLQSSDSTKNYYFKVYDEVELGLATDPNIRGSIIAHGRDIDSNTNNADMKGAIKEVRHDISKCITDYKKGELKVVNKMRGNIIQNHK